MNPQSIEPIASTPSVADPPGGDHDQPYTWGRPASTYLSFREMVRVTILHSKLESQRADRRSGDPL